MVRARFSCKCIDRASNVSDFHKNCIFSIIDWKSRLKNKRSMAGSSTVRARRWEPSIDIWVDPCRSISQRVRAVDKKCRHWGGYRTFQNSLLISKVNNFRTHRSFEIKLIKLSLIELVDNFQDQCSPKSRGRKALGQRSNLLTIQAWILGACLSQASIIIPVRKNRKNEHFVSKVGQFFWYFCCKKCRLRTEKVDSMKACNFINFAHCSFEKQLIKAIAHLQNN